MIAIDTNVLVYAHRRGAALHGAAQRAIEAAAGVGMWGYSLYSVSEFWCQVTHPRYPGGASSAEQARGFLVALQEAGATIFEPSQGFGERLMEAAASLGVRGARVFDLQIGLTARENGAHEIWTHDRNFTRLRGLRVIDPFAQG